MIVLDTNVISEMWRATRRRSGRPIAEADAEIAAISRSRDAILATRNLDDFAGCTIELVDPWTA